MDSDVLLGSIHLFAFEFAPRGWARCDGALLSIQQNQALYQALSNTFGGDGKSTFALPNIPPLSREGPFYLICTNGVYPPRP